MMTTFTSTLRPELKARHRRMWALGDYPSVASEVVAELGPTAVEAAAVGPGDRVLDVAAGSGNAAIPAARRGAEVVATDLTPELLDVGRRDAEAEGLALTWQEADAEDLPFPDAAFDVVVSSVGVMFAPDHRASADELVRVLRPGGRLALVSWTPEGFIGRMFATMKPYVPAPPPGVQPPPLWGDEEHVAGLLGDRVVDLRAQRRSLRVTTFGDAATFLAFFKERYGPTIAAYAGLADDPARAAALDTDLLALAAAHDVGDGAMDWEYLLVTAVRG